MKLVEIGVDQVDNLCFDLLKEIGGTRLDGTEMPWDIEAIAPVREAVEEALKGVYDVELVYTDDSLCGDGGPMKFDDEKAVALTNEILAELEKEENVPCKRCGRTDLPLHEDYRCPECRALMEKYPRTDWQYEVRNGDTLLGYDEWLDHRKEAE